MFAELGTSMQVTTRSDVYSFGMVALEVMMGVHPGDLVNMLSSTRFYDPTDILLKEILDPRLPTPTGQWAAEVMFIVTIALACTGTAPEMRPKMRSVARELSAKTHAFLSDPIGSTTVRQLANFQR